MKVCHVVLHPDDQSHVDREREQRGPAADAVRAPKRCRHPPLMLLCNVDQFKGVDVGYGDGIVPVTCLTRIQTVKKRTVPTSATHGRFVQANVKCSRRAVPAIDARVGTGHAFQGRNVPRGVSFDLATRYPNPTSRRRNDETGEWHREFSHTQLCIARKGIYTALTR